MPAVLDGIRSNPPAEAAWLALAGYYRDHGRDDEAAALRVFWPAVRESLAGRPLELLLDDLRRHANVLGRRAREAEDRAAARATDD